MTSAAFFFAKRKPVNATWKSELALYECKHIKRHTHIYKSTQLVGNEPTLKVQSKSKFAVCKRFKSLPLKGLKQNILPSWRERDTKDYSQFLALLALSISFNSVAFSHTLLITANKIKLYKTSRCRNKISNFQHWSWFALWRICVASSSFGEVVCWAETSLEFHIMDWLSFMLQVFSRSIQALHLLIHRLQSNGSFERVAWAAVLHNERWIIRSRYQHKLGTRKSSRRSSDKHVIWYYRIFFGAYLILAKHVIQELLYIQF